MSHEEGFLKGRALDFFRLEPPVRRIVLTTGIVLLAVAIACALRENFPGPVFRLPDGFLLPVAVMLLAGATGTLALTLLITGAAHAQSRWRYALLIPIAFGIAIVFGAALSTVPLSTGAARIALAAGFILPIVFVVAAGYFGKRYRIIPVFWVLLAFAALCTAAVIAISFLQTPNFGASFILYMVGIGAVGLEPALLVVGFDLADIGSDAAGLAASLVERKAGWFERSVRLSLVVLAIAGVVFIFHLIDFDWIKLAVASGWFAALVIVSVLAIVFTARRKTAPDASHAPEYQYLLVVAAVVTIAALILSFAKEPLPGYWSSDGLREFSFVPPQGLSESGPEWPLPGNKYDPRWPSRVMFAGSNGWPLVAVIGVPRPPFAQPGGTFHSMNAMISRKDLSKMMPVVGATGADGWARGNARAADKKGNIFLFFIMRREVPTDSASTDMDWYLICGDATASRCETLATSFENRASERPSHSLLLIFDLLFFAAAAGVFVFAWYRSRTGDTAGWDFVFWVLFLNGLRGMVGYISGGNDFPFYDTHVSATLACSLLALFALGVLVLEVWPRARFDLVTARRIAGRSAANFIVIAGLFLLYIFAIEGSDESQIIRGVIICFALLWELAMSGERLNLSADHHLFPRSSRVFTLVGYLLLVSTIVFVMTGLTDDRGKEATGWNSELFVANGIVLLGGALTLNRAVRAFARLVRGETGEAVEEAAD